MITIFVGQRGTGKTSLLRRIETYLKEDMCFNYSLIDLDAEIEKREGQSISTIFQNHGESYFRKKELECFQNIIWPYLKTSPQSESEMVDLYISVGGGFSMDSLSTLEIGKQIKIIYLQRASEKIGRIFLDRPSLEKELSPLEEFFYRRKLRHPRFLDVAAEEYLIPEGLTNPSMIEKQILLTNPSNVGGVLTLLPHHFTSPAKWHYFIQRRLQWGVKFFEVRDDLLTKEQIQWVQRDIPQNNILFSRRLKTCPVPDFECQFQNIDYDREVDRGVNKKAGQGLQILSIHHYHENESLHTLLKNMESYEAEGFHLKLAVEIKNFEELKLAENWQQQSPNNRSFLPRSSEGRWMWYRLWKGNHQKLNFWREGEGSAVDQPSLYQWINKIELECANKKSQFAALLGNPVEHSFTPIHQGEYFKKYGLPVYPIQLDEDEFEFGLSFLEELGLRAAAVTSPLKLIAYKMCSEKTTLANEFHSVNTMFLKSQKLWMGHNTDLEGLRALFIEAEKALGGGEGALSKIPVSVWGGGGTLPLLKKLLPQAEYFSVQTGQSRELKDLHGWNPEVVIWAGGRYQEEGTKGIPVHWMPRMIIDLNYREDSGGRELSIKTKSIYISGLSMFYKQAEGQQQFWSQYFLGKGIE